MMVVAQSTIEVEMLTLIRPAAPAPAPVENVTEKAMVRSR